VCGTVHHEVLYAFPPVSLVHATVERRVWTWHCATVSRCVLVVPVNILAPYRRKLLAASVLPYVAPYGEGFVRIRSPGSRIKKGKIMLGTRSVLASTLLLFLLLLYLQVMLLLLLLLLGPQLLSLLQPHLLLLLWLLLLFLLILLMGCRPAVTAHGAARRCCCCCYCCCSPHRRHCRAIGPDTAVPMITVGVEA
jgi:hypothetical protein